MISSYGTKDVFFLKDEGQTIPLEAVLTQLFKGFVRFKNPRYQPKVIAVKDIKDFMIMGNISDEGYFHIIVENRSKNLVLNVTINFKQERIKNGIFLTPTPTPFVYPLVLPPNSGPQVIIGR